MALRDFGAARHLLTGMGVLYIWLPQIDQKGTKRSKNPMTVEGEKKVI